MPFIQKLFDGNVNFNNLRAYSSGPFDSAIFLSLLPIFPFGAKTNVWFGTPVPRSCKSLRPLPELPGTQEIESTAMNDKAKGCDLREKCGFYCHFMHSRSKVWIVMIEKYCNGTDYPLCARRAYFQKTGLCAPMDLTPVGQLTGEIAPDPKKET